VDKKDNFNLMNLERFIIRLSWGCMLLGFGMSLAGAIWLGVSSLTDETAPDFSQVKAKEVGCQTGSSCERIQYTIESKPDPQNSASIDAAPRNPPLALSLEQPETSANSQNGSNAQTQAANTNLAKSADLPLQAIEYYVLWSGLFLPKQTLNAPGVPPNFGSAGDTLEVRRATAGDTLTITSDSLSSGSLPSVVTTTAATPPAAELAVAESDTSMEDEVAGGCPVVSNVPFDLIPIEGASADRPGSSHGDLSLSLRGYTPIQGSTGLVFYAGATDADAPQLAGLFQPNRAAVIEAVYRVNQWIWEAQQCGGNGHGCAGPPITDWEVTLIGLGVTPGEIISIPERNAPIYGGGYRALVLYADEQQITLGYARRDTVAAGYVIHLEGVCVDPNLLALHRRQHDANGWRVTGSAPALRNDQALGIASGSQLKVAIRDHGSFMDPRSSKDWWQGY